MLAGSSALIIDDVENDAYVVADLLRSIMIPYYLYLYDEETLILRQEKCDEKLSGIRIIFQDLQLASQGTPSTVDFDAAVTAIQTLVSEENGPWLLITWSTWAAEGSDHGGALAKNLFDHLCRELPINIRPFSYMVLDSKSSFSSGGLHDKAKSRSEISAGESAALRAEIETKTAAFEAIKSLISWEKEAKKAISNTILEVTRVVNGSENADQLIGSMLHEMALAEAGKNTESDYLARSLTETLSSVLRDNFNPKNLPFSGIKRFPRLAGLQNGLLGNWKARLNKVLHFENAETGGAAPGSIYNIEDNFDLLPLGSSDPEKLYKFKRENFLFFTKNESIEKKCVTKATELVVLDITPPCDHAQNKSKWRKLIVGVKLDSNIVHYANKIDYKINERGSQIDGEYLIKLPEMIISEGGQPVYFIFNSRLVFSVEPSHISHLDETKYLGRIREQLQNDLRSWLIRQTTRPGIVEFR